MISVLDMFKIGIGPSSSHTVGPMKASKQFVDDLINQRLMPAITRVDVDVYGSLSLTGEGHHTDIAIILGLMGNLPGTVKIDDIPSLIAEVKNRQRLGRALELTSPHGGHEIAFPCKNGQLFCQDGERSPEGGMVFHRSNLPLHENGMQIHAFAGNDKVYSKTYYSIGGGFIVDEESFGQEVANEVQVPYPFHSASDILRHCKKNNLSFSSMVMKNELALRSKQNTSDEQNTSGEQNTNGEQDISGKQNISSKQDITSEQDIKRYCADIWQTMQGCIERGTNTEGVLPGPLKVPRRAAVLRRLLDLDTELSRDPLNVIEWVNMFALAVNEENAAGGRVVTAPTNGACGIVPAVLAYYHKFIEPVTTDVCTRYFLVTGAIGVLYKMNASISGAEVGCQGEVGVACSMAAAGLAELLGLSPEQVCMAAEIGMEHNLGLTCDPIAGQVQVPCIERNAIASVKAINAARMAKHRASGEPRISLDKVIEAMSATGRDMNAKYRETSLGGLALALQPDIDQAESQHLAPLDKVIEKMYGTDKGTNAKYRKASHRHLAIKVKCS